MNLQFLFFGALAGFALLQWWALPRLEAAWAANGTAGKLAKAGSIASLKAARTVLQIAILVYGSLLATIWLLDIIGYPVAAAALHARIEFLEQLKGPLTVLKEHVATKIAFGVAVLGLAYLVRRRHRADLIAQVAARIDSEIERLKAEKERGKWTDLPPTAEMEQIREELDRLYGYASEAQEPDRARIGELIEALKRRWTEADLRRRLDLAEEPVCEPFLARRLWPRITALLTSRGFVRDSALPAKGCSYAGTAVMCLSLIGMAGSVLETQIDARIAHAWDLYVNADQTEAQESWNKIRKQVVAKDKDLVGQLDLQHSQNIAHSFVHAYLSTSVWPQATRDENVIKAGAVRAHILKTHSAPVHAVTESIRDQPDSMLVAAEEVALNPTRTAKLEERLARQLVDEVDSSSPSVRDRLSAKLASFTAAYAEPANPSELVKAVLGELLDPTLEAVQPETAKTAVKELAKTVSKGLKTAIERSIEIQFDRFLSELAGETSFADAISRVAQTSPESAGLTPRDKEAVNAFSQRIEADMARTAAKVASMPAAFVRSDPAGTDQPGIGHLADKLRQTLRANGNLDTTPAMDFLATYEDYFANNESSAAATIRARLFAETGQGLNAADFKNAAARARDFEKLTAFNRVGGVLIGRSASSMDSNGGLDGFSLRWEGARGGRIALVLTNASGQETRLGPYPPDIVYRALLFSADGRPLVVTILNTGLPETQKVLLHPTLVDTEVGCEMTELDKFIFDYIDKNLRDKHNDEIEKVKRYDGVYYFAWLHSIHSRPDLGKRYFDAMLSEHVGRSTPETLRSTLEDPLLFLREEVGKLNFEAMLRDRDITPEALQSTLEDRQLFFDPKRSPVASQYRVYSKPVLETMRSCWQSGERRLDRFGDCIERVFKGVQLEKTDAAFLQNEPKRLEIVSGVRERRFSVDPKLTFIQRGIPTSGRPLGVPDSRH